MARTKTAKGGKRPIEQYSHTDKKRVNNPPVGLVAPDTDQKEPKHAYAYDPHFDPSLQWAGKAERISFEVPTVSLHVHERVDPRSILEAVRKKNGKNYEQLSLFSSKAENPPLREAIEFTSKPTDGPWMAPRYEPSSPSPTPEISRLFARAPIVTALPGDHEQFVARRKEILAAEERIHAEEKARFDERIRRLELAHLLNVKVDDIRELEECEREQGAA